MKIVNCFLFVFALMLSLESCSDINGISPVFYQAKGIDVKLTSTNWYTTADDLKNKLHLGTVNLFISGSTNAEKIFIETAGDGILGWHSLNLNDQKTFSYSIEISFCVTDQIIKGTETSMESTLRAVKGTDTMDINLKSGKLVY
jgi:hypothetical protein